MNLFQLYSINYQRLWKVNPDTGECVHFGPKDREYNGKLYFIAGRLYSNNGGDFSEVERDTGEPRLIRQGGWKAVTSLVANSTGVYALNGNQLVTVALGSGEFTPFGKEDWSNDTQLACVDDQLYAVAEGIFYRINRDGSRYVLSKKWAPHAKLAVLGSTLFALDQNKLWRWSEDHVWQHLGNEHWRDTGFLISAGSILFGVDKGSFWQINTYTGESSRLGDGTWSDCSSCVAEPVKVDRITSPYRASSYQWIKGEQHTHVSGIAGREAQGPNGKINNYEILRKMFAQGDYDFVIATGHESFPDRTEKLWSINSSKNEPSNSVPACVTDGSRYMLVIAGMERQHNRSKSYDNVSLQVSEKLHSANVHTRYIDNDCNPACCLHPSYYATQYIPAKKGVLSELELLVTKQDLSSKGKPIIDSLEVFNDFGAYQDQFRSTPYDKEQMHRGKGRGFAEDFWDQVLLTGRNMWAHAGDCSFYYQRSGDGLGETQGRIGAGWIMVQLDHPFTSSDYKTNKEKIIRAIESGKFYATTGVTLSTISVSGNSISITANKKLRWRSIIGPNIFYQPVNDVSEYSVTFPAGAKYLRIECTDLSDQDRFRYYGCYPKAWTQVFWPERD